MRLAEAMRLGAMLRPQCVNTLFARHLTTPEQGASFATCALGSADEAAGLLRFPAELFDAVVQPAAHAAEAQFPELALSWTVPCPLCGDDEIGLIPHLNDDHGWTREAIADFVERVLEPLAYPTPAPAPTEVVSC